MQSGIVYSTWADAIVRLSSKPEEAKYLTALSIAIFYGSTNKWELAEFHIKSVSGFSLDLWETIIKPQILANLDRRADAKKHGESGGRPCNYEKNVTKMIRKMDSAYHSEELITVLCSWFEHLNKNKKPTKIDNLKETFEEISRQTTSAAGAIRIIKRNLEIGNLELDFDIMHNQDYVRLDDSE
jgi:hypothetical protein